MLHIADKLGGDMVKLGGLGAVRDDKALHSCHLSTGAQ